MSLDNPVIAYLATCGDTVTSCYQRHEPNCLYLDGLKPPHYPVPAIPIQVGYQTSRETQLYPSSYWYVCSRELLWSLWDKYPMSIERT